MNVEQFIKHVEGGRIFTATFIKRGDGEMRTMNCRMGVLKHAKGGELAYDPSKLKLLPVYDLQKNAYRQIALEGLLTVRMDGKEYAWIEGVLMETKAAETHTAAA